MNNRPRQNIHIGSSTNLAVTINTHDTRMSSDRLNINFMLNKDEDMDAKLEPTEHSGQLFPIRPRPATIEANRRPTASTHSLHSPNAMSFKYESETDNPKSPDSSTSEWSQADYTSQRPPVDCVLPPVRLGCPKPEEYSQTFARLPPMHVPQWPSLELQHPGPSQYRETVCMNESHPSHSCNNCWQQTRYGPTWTCCHCLRTIQNQEKNHALVDYQLQLQGLESRNKARLDGQRSHLHISRGSCSPQRHEPSTLDRNFPQRHEPYSTTHRAASHSSKPQKKASTNTLRAPHSNKKYTRPQVYWMRYRKEDCSDTFDGIVSQWEAQWPGQRADTTAGAVSSRYYRDNLMPLFDSQGSILKDANGKIVMDSCKVRQRSSNPEHREYPFTFVEKLPHQALDPENPFPVSEEHKEKARKIIQEDAERPTSIGALCRTALREFEAAMAPPSSSQTVARSAKQEGKLADAAGYVILVESKALKEACSCHKNRHGEEVVHRDGCGVGDHPALRACQCPAEVRARTSLHLPYCPTTKWAVEKAAARR